MQVALLADSLADATAGNNKAINIDINDITTRTSMSVTPFGFLLCIFHTFLCIFFLLTYIKI